MNHRPTPSEVFTTAAGDPAPAPDEPAPGGHHTDGRHGDADTEMHRLDNRALIIVGIAVLLLFAGPFGWLPLGLGAPEALVIARYLTIGIALLCQATAVVLAWQALRIEPIAAEDAEAAAAHARDAVHDKREGTTRAAGILVAAVVLATVSTAGTLAAYESLQPQPAPAAEFPAPVEFPADGGSPSVGQP